MRTFVLLVLSLLFVFSGAAVKSQAQLPAGSVRSHVEGIDIPPVANAPFTAKVVVTWNQPMVGGGTLSRKYYTLVARDSLGRIRREIRDFVPADSDAEPNLRSFTVMDPVAGTRTVCTTGSMNCATSTFHPRLSVPQDAGGSTSRGAAKVSRESLGQQTMNDLTVVGTRETATNFSGSHGARRLSITRSEIWYSPDLSMNLSVTRTNPQTGEVTLQMTDLVRGEPNSSWFAIPAGYEVRAAR